MASSQSIDLNLFIGSSGTDASLEARWPDPMGQGSVRTLMTSLTHDKQKIFKFLNREDIDPNFKVLG